MQELSIYLLSCFVYWMQGLKISTSRNHVFPFVSFFYNLKPGYTTNISEFLSKDFSNIKVKTPLFI